MALTYQEFVAWAEQAERAVPSMLAGFAQRARKFPDSVEKFLPQIERRMRDPQLQARWTSMGIPVPSSVLSPTTSRRTPQPAPQPERELTQEEARAMLAHVVERFREMKAKQASVGS